jgi:hypothetical protein
MRLAVVEQRGERREVDPGGRQVQCAQGGHASPEFWYDCAPGDLAQRNIFGPPPCDAPYREVEVRIDRWAARRTAWGRPGRAAGSVRAGRARVATGRDW